MDTLKYLLFLNVALVSVNVVISGALWYLTRAKLHLFSFYFWISAVSVWGVQSVTASKGDLYKVLGFALSSFVGHLLISHSIAASGGLVQKRRFPVIAMFFGATLTSILAYLEFPPRIMAMPALLGCCYVVVETSLKALYRQRKSLSSSSAWLAIAGLVFGLYNFTYITAFDDPSKAIPGFVMGLILVFIFSTLLPTVAIEQVTKERAAAEAENKFRASLMHSAKMTALGEMAGGVAHEINNPLAILMSLSELIHDAAESDHIDRGALRENAGNLQVTISRIVSIVSGLRKFARDGSRDGFASIGVLDLTNSTLSFCREKFKSFGIGVLVEDIDQSISFEGRATEISQVLINLLNNSFDAVCSEKEKWIRISVTSDQDLVEIRVTDSGPGMPREVREKLFQPFFTTKEIGKGTGLGLSISAGIVQSHGGHLRLDEHCANTSFVIRIPQKQRKDSMRAIS